MAHPVKILPIHPDEIRSRFPFRYRTSPISQTLKERIQRQGLHPSFLPMGSRSAPEKAVAVFVVRLVMDSLVRSMRKVKPIFAVFDRLFSPKMLP